MDISTFSGVSANLNPQDNLQEKSASSSSVPKVEEPQQPVPVLAATKSTEKQTAREWSLDSSVSRSLKTSTLPSEVTNASQDNKEVASEPQKTPKGIYFLGYDN
jgi:hypothetical protein